MNDFSGQLVILLKI